MGTHAIHHVTAVTADIGQNLEFYTGTLGLRLVKRSVNQDDVSAYHLFYADAIGSPGTDMTFFDWPTIGENVPGLASAALTSFRVPEGSLAWWEDRLERASAVPVRTEDSILFADPEGQRLELVAEAHAELDTKPWLADISHEHAIRGILGVDLQSARPDATRAVLVDVLGYRARSDQVYETTDGTGRVRILESDSRRFSHLGAGGVHHVAFRVDDDEELLALQAKIEAAGIGTSGLVDRYYFHSLYFREPGGVLFELATDGPGFASDEPAETLGERLALPPFLEPRRLEIEAGLKPLPVKTA